MDPINPISGNPEAVGSVPNTPQPLPPPKDSHWITILSMAIFVLLSLGAVAFLYYQNQQLKGMLSNYQTSVASPTPIPTSSPKGYSSYYNPSGSRFTLDFPQECQTNAPIECTTEKFRIVINPQAIGRAAGAAPKVSNLKIGNFTWERRIFVESTYTYATYSFNQDGTDYLLEVVYYPHSSEVQSYFEKILSTFKFTEASGSTSPTAIPKGCTEEAKLCPDGSSVGRTGPNCEFPACPQTSY